MRARGEKGNDTSGATRQILAGVFVAGLLASVGLLHVAGKVAALDAGYQLAKVEDQHRTLERENAALKLQVATLRSAAHIEAYARAQGMSAPGPQAIFKIGAPLPAKAAAAPHLALLGGERD